MCCIEFNALSNGISLQTGINLESIHVNFKRDMSIAMPYDVHYIYVEFYISDYPG